MVPTVRPVTDDEMEGWMRATRIPFLDTGRGECDDGWAVRWRTKGEGVAAWAADDGGRIVGTCASHRMQVALPASPGGACPSVPMTGVTAVGVHPTHRRRGLLTRLMGEMLADAIDRGEPLAGLLATEALIYGRFGYGVATRSARVSLDTTKARFAHPVPELDVRLVEADEARRIIPPIFERTRAAVPGGVSRPPELWEPVWADRPADRDGRSETFYAVTDGGFAMYKGNRGTHEQATLYVRHLCADDPATEAGLWQFLAGIDLTVAIEAEVPPEGLALPYRLVDFRALSTTAVEDFLWLRVLDVPAALEARGYLTEGRVVLDVEAAPAGIGGDRTDPAAGHWVLDAGPDGATCRAAGAGDAPDLRLGVAALGSLLLGDVRPSVLAAAGRVAEVRPGALAEADRMFASDIVPFCRTGF